MGIYCQKCGQKWDQKWTPKSSHLGLVNVGCQKLGMQAGKKMDFKIGSKLIWGGQKGSNSIEAKLHLIIMLGIVDAQMFSYFFEMFQNCLES